MIWRKSVYLIQDAHKICSGGMTLINGAEDLKTVYLQDRKPDKTAQSHTVFEINAFSQFTKTLNMAAKMAGEPFWKNG